MKSALLRKRAFTGYPNEVELLSKSGDRLFEVDSLRQPGQRMLCAVSEDGSKDYPVFNEESEKVTWQQADRFSKKFKDAVKKHMKGEVEEAETPKEQEEATNDPSLRTASKKVALLPAHQPKGNLLPINQWEIVRTPDDSYRYVNHEEKLLSTGFGSEEALKRNADIIRMDEGPLVLMRERYAKEFLPSDANPAGPQAHRTIPYQYTPSGRRGSKSAKMGKCRTCHQERSLNRDAVCHQCEQEERDAEQEKTDSAKTAAGGPPIPSFSGLPFGKPTRCPKCGSPDIDKSATLAPNMRCNECKHTFRKQAATVHDLKPLLDELRKKDPLANATGSDRMVEEAIGLTNQLMQAAKQVGARDLLQAARHYLDVLKNISQYSLPGSNSALYYLGLNKVPSRTRRAHDRAWKLIEAAYTHFVR